MNRIIWINLILGTALCFVVFWEIIIFILAYTVWMIAFCFLITYANNSAHRKMYALKMKNDWVVPDQRRKNVTLIQMCQPRSAKVRSVSIIME